MYQVNISSQKTTPQTGNVNPQMGAANKKMIENRLNNHKDPLTFNLVKLVCSDLEEVLSSCVVRSNDDLTLRGSEMAMLYEARLTNGQIVSDSINVASKGSIGLGSLNQLAIFWLNTVLSVEELKSPAGQALTMMVGATQNSDKPKAHIEVGELMSGANAASLGFPLQCWLGEQSNLKKFVFKGLNISKSNKNKSVLLINMRNGGLAGEDIFVMVDANSFGEAIIKESIKETSKNKKFVQINSGDSMIHFSRGMSLKRIGGANVRGNSACQMQLIVQTKGLLDMISNPLPNNKIKFCLAMEEPKPESVAINKMNVNFNAKEDDTFISKYTGNLLKNIEKVAVDFDTVNA